MRASSSLVFKEKGMPPLNSPMHVRMLREAERDGQPTRDGIYGLHWGDPEQLEHLQTVRDHWVLPYVRGDQAALEIGPGGGRWTRYLLPFRRIYAVDYHAELLAELRKNFPHSHIIEILNNGTDFPGVPPASVDFVFSFGTFVHLDPDIIPGYLANLRAVVRPTAQLIIQYSDKDKPEAQKIAGFSDNDPRRMRAMVESVGYRIEEEDTAILNHSSIMRFVLA
jgi:SAM-dependent methyltransferase